MMLMMKTYRKLGTAAKLLRDVESVTVSHRSSSGRYPSDDVVQSGKVRLDKVALVARLWVIQGVGGQRPPRQVGQHVHVEPGSTDVIASRFHFAA